jgi:hypothetical protein
VILCQHKFANEYMNNKNWIQSAIKKPGSFTAQAKRADMGTQSFANKVLSNKDKFSKRTEQRAALARKLNSFNK